MALNGKGTKPSNNTTAAPSPKVRLSSTGGSIAKNNTNFGTGGMGTIGGLKQKSVGAVNTNPQTQQLKSTGAPAGGAMKTKTKLPSGMTQPSARKLKVGKNRYAQPNAQVRGARGASDSTVSNLKSYLARKAQGKVR